jgi:LysM repeat protein
MSHVSSKRRNRRRLRLQGIRVTGFCAIVVLFINGLPPIASGQEAGNEQDDGPAAVGIAFSPDGAALAVEVVEGVVEVAAEEPAEPEEPAVIAVEGIEAAGPAPPAVVLQVDAAAVQIAAPAALVPAAAGVNQIEVDGVPLVPRGHDGWRYWDQSDDPGAEWSEPDFDDSQWPTGAAPLGYGDPHIKKEIAFGGDANKKNLVAFFRHTFAIAEGEAPEAAVGAVMCDDAAAVYINGKEVFRHNLKAGDLDLTTLSENAVSGDVEQQFHQFIVEPGVFREGENVVAVRVHQTNQTSSDLGFDFELKAVEPRVARRLALRLNGNVRLLRARRAAGRNFIHLTDGEMTYFDGNGLQMKQRNDAVMQANTYVPGAKLVRVMEGDTLAKIAARYQVDLDRLALLNRTRTTRVFSTTDVVCTSWVHDVAETETIDSLADLYETSVATLRKLNGLADDKPLEPGQKLQVPGQFSYHFQPEGQSYLRLARYVEVERPMPFDPQSQRIRREQLEEGEDLAAFARRTGVDERQIRKLNALPEDGDIPPGYWLLAEYSVVLNEGATVAELVNYFGVELDRLLEANDLKDADQVPADRRVQIPLGDRMGQPQPAEAGQPDVPVVEFVLGQGASKK